MSSAVTQCPHCQAKFRVRPEHVRAHGGLVRCGACRGVFDARLNLIEGELDELLDDKDTFGAPATIMQGEQAKTAPLPDAPSPEAIREATRAAIAKKPSAPTPQQLGREVEKWNQSFAKSNEATPKENKASSVIVEQVVTPKAKHQNEQPELGTPSPSYDWRAPVTPMSGGQKAVWITLSLLLMLGLTLNIAYWFRDELASRFPVTAPALVAGCAKIGCRVTPPRKTDALGFVGSDLAADPSHKGLLIFSATLRNSGGHNVAYPSLILTIDGAGGEPIARRTFAPEQYLSAGANLAAGLEGGGETEIKLYLDVSPMIPIGFKTDLAYF